MKDSVNAPCRTLLEGLRTARNKDWSLQSSFLISCSIAFPIGAKAAPVLHFLNVPLESNPKVLTPNNVLL